MKQWQEAKLQQLILKRQLITGQEFTETVDISVMVRYPDILHGKKITEMVEMAVTVEPELTAYHNNSIF